MSEPLVHILKLAFLNLWYVHEKGTFFLNELTNILGVQG
jgi:hypothetical protein